MNSKFTIPRKLKIAFFSFQRAKCSILELPEQKVWLRKRPLFCNFFILGIPENPNNFPDGFKSRQLEFEEFEKKFEECITRSAIATKFSQHVSGGENTVKHLSKMLANLNTSALEIRNIANDEADTQKMRKNFNKEQMEKVTKKVHEQISMITVSSFECNKKWFKI